MTKEFTFVPRGVCSRRIDIKMEDDVITALKFQGGCAGNTQGLAALAVGMTANEVIKRLSGIRCGFKPTSCPDQLAEALKRVLAEA